MLNAIFTIQYLLKWNFKNHWMKIDGNEILILQETLPWNKYIHVEYLEWLFEHVLWNNKLLQYKSIPSCFKNWIQSRILNTKDIFYESGEMHDILYFSNRIIKKNNILCEYYMVKNSVRAYIRKFDCSNPKYVTIKKRRQISFQK